jgi:Autophagy protein Apg9.
LEKHLTYFALVNLALAPFTIFWHFILIALNHVQEIKQNPGLFTLRHWSLYSLYYLRHFNELDHELSARLTRAWRPASRYMSSFTSPVLAVVAKNIIFIASAGLAVLLLWTLLDNSVSQLEEVLTSVLVLTSVIVILKAFIPDENLVWCPEDLMTVILKQIHYCPTWWKGQAHTTRVRDEFSQLFQYKIVYVLQQLCSPLVTPYILYFHLKPKSLEIVDFFRNFTVEVMGVGDVCSFAQMDVKKHGSPLWQMTETPATTTSTKYDQAEGGKTELSLMHFTQTNPYWKPPTEEAQNFVSMVKNEAKREMVSTVYGDNADNASFMSSYGVNINSMYTGHAGPSHATARPPPVQMNISRMEGPAAPCVPPNTNPLPNFPFGDISQEMSGMGGNDMSISALYLHELHHRHAGTSGVDMSSLFRSRSQPQERTPLLHQDKHS